MNTSTQAMSNVNKVQTPATGNKPKQGQQEAELNFTELFSSALGQSAPKAQLNNIENQLRESLYKQDKPKKSNDNNANAEAAQAAQAAVWAQRNWMQTAPIQPAAPQTAAVTTEPAKQALAPENTERTSENTAEKVADTASANKAPSNDTADQTANAAAANNNESKAASNGEPLTQATLAGKTATAGNTENQETPLGATTNPAAELPNNTSANGKPADLSATMPGAEQNTRPGIKTTAQLKTEATLANSTVTARTDSASTANTAAAVSTNTVAAQLAPQIAPQLAQQVQATGEALGEEGLKAGQKILATGNLQSTGIGNSIAAGTNGLGGTSASVQPTLIKTPVNQPGFAKELGQTVQWAIGKNLSTVDIRVNPESFGPMNMRLMQKGQQVQLVIRTQDEASANLLTQALGGLKEVLAQNGLQLNQVQIQHGNTPNPQGQANNGQPQFEQNHGKGQGSGQHAAHGNNSQAETAAPAASPTDRKPEGKLDLFA